MTIVKEDTRDQMLKLCNTGDPEEIADETKVEHENNKKVVIAEYYKYFNSK